MNLSEKVGDRIKKFREAKRMSQEELAYQTGMYQSQIYRFEYGKQRINIEQLEKISEVLGVPVVEFFKTDVEVDKDFDNQQLLEIIFQMTEEQKKELVEILRNLKDFDFRILRKAAELVRLIKES